MDKVERDKIEETKLRGGKIQRVSEVGNIKLYHWTQGPFLSDIDAYYILFPKDIHAE